MQDQLDIQKLVRENVKNLLPYSSARDEYTSDGAGKIFLDANENPFNNGLNRYPDPQQRALKAVLADKKGLSTEQILLGNGSDEILDLLFRAFCEPGKDSIITLPPTYGMYKVLAAVNDITNREVQLNEAFEPNVDAILSSTTADTKMLIFCSPNNPTGNSFSHQKIKTLLENFKGLVVIDEAYIDFSANAGWLSGLDTYANLVITQTFSKAYGLAGLRLGVCYASEEIISILNKIKPPYNINELTQQRVLQAAIDSAEVETQVKEIIAERTKLFKILPQMPCINKVYPSDANFILARVDQADKRYEQLKEAGIIVRNRSGQPKCKNTLRFTVGTKDENNRLITVLKAL